MGISNHPFTVYCHVSWKIRQGLRQQALAQVFSPTTLSLAY
jgi:hypothetical protein